MSKTVSQKKRVAVVGGGIAGSTIALYLSKIGLDVTLFEKGPSLVNGPPICHLHAGGNLYREISDQQCVTLLKESIDLIRFYPDAVDYRPTAIAVPLSDKGRPEDLYSRLELLRKEYASLINDDIRNKVLGESDDYYKCYDRKEIQALQKLKPLAHPTCMDEWMIPVAQNIDLDKVQFPIIMVQEYGLNLFRLASSAALSLNNTDNCRVLLNHNVTNIAKTSDTERWDIEYTSINTVQYESFDFLINAAGFRSGKIDDMLGFKRERFVEFKAAYVSQWNQCESTWPEIIFYGERGTPNGMGQFTPYPDGHFQLHAMTKEITLFEEGLVKSSEHSAQPRLNTKFLTKIEKQWDPEDVRVRSKLAIEHLAQYIPAFKNATIVSKPLYGAQQIPGQDATLRAADVSFEDQYYARCEIVKASSVLSMADTITKQLIDLGYVDKAMYRKRDFSNATELDDRQVQSLAQKLCIDRDYPIALTQRIMPKVS